MKKAEARLKIAKNKSKALEKEADAESVNASSMDGVRMHKEKMALANQMQSIAAQSNMVVSG